jgi:hypothetical protein
MSVELAEGVQQRAHGPGLPEALDDPLGSEPAVRQRSHQRVDGVGMLRERQPGAGHEPHVGVVVVEHVLQPGHSAVEPELPQDQHGTPARRARAAAKLMVQPAGQARAARLAVQEHLVRPGAGRLLEHDREVELRLAAPDRAERPP